MTILTAANRNRAIIALENAIAENRPIAYDHAADIDGSVCSCVVIGEAVLAGEALTELRRLPQSVYKYLGELGFNVVEIARANDLDQGGFKAAIKYLEGVDVVKEAEEICRQAVLTNV